MRIYLYIRAAFVISSGRVVLSGKANFVYVFDINKNTVINRIDVFGSEILINGFAESADTSEVRTTSIYGIGRTLSVISSQDYREIATLNVNEDVLGALLS